jgi:hypothetical protein
VPAGPSEFPAVPNPQLQPDGTLQTDSVAYAQAYYRAIDPNNDKDTLAKWKTANNFDSGTGTQVGVVFGDVRDLGYGRRMTARQNVDGTIASRGRELSRQDRGGVRPIRDSTSTRPCCRIGAGTTRPTRSNSAPDPAAARAS